MEKKLLSKYSREVVEPLLNLYFANYDRVELVGTHQSCVYRHKLDGKNIYIRITLGQHRTVEQIVCELNMLQYLYNHNFDVVRPIKSIKGNLVESRINGDNQFIVVAFTEAIGLGIGQYPWSLDVPFRVGVMTGKLHNLLEVYDSSLVNRPKWDENKFLMHAKQYLPKNHELILSQIDSLVGELKQLPISYESYGLTHGDMVACNYNMTDETITLFDFDESSYCWFVNDIAISVFYDSLGWKGIVDVEDTKESFVSLINGYRSVRKIEAYWISKIPLFLRLREIILYVAIHRSHKLNEIDDWSRNFMDGRKERIEKGVSYIDLDFTTLC